MFGTSDMVQCQVARDPIHKGPGFINVAAALVDLADPDIGFLHDVLYLPWRSDAHHRTSQPAPEGQVGVQ